MTDEEPARAIRLDPSQIAGLGLSLEALIAMLLEPETQNPERYETDSVRRKAADAYRHRGAAVDPPRKFRKVYWQVLADEQIYDFERLWYQVGDDVAVRPRIGRRDGAFGREKYEVEELAAKYAFTGRESMTVPQALATGEELEKIDELLKQLEEASKNAQIGVIDMDLLSEFAEPGDMEQLGELRQMIEDYMREMAERQGIERDAAGFRLTPKAYRLFQSKLLEKIFANLQASRTGRHQGLIVGEGSVEL
ncbi:MAG: hypothetical protein R3C99_23615 [Pirellulaceae bacterium]